MNNLDSLVYNYPTHYKEGFLQNEIEDLLSKFPNSDKDKFNNSLIGDTYIFIDSKPVLYRIDILRALNKSLQ